MSNFLKRTKRASEEIAYDAIHEKAKEQHYYPGISYQRLFDVINEAGPTPTISQMTDIIHVVKTDFIDDKSLSEHNKAIIKDLHEQRQQLARKDNKIRLLRKALTRMVAEFDTTTPVIPNQKEAVRYANNLLQSNDE